MISPFDTEPIEEIPLTRSPLVTVLSQVRFPKTPALTTETGVTPLHQALRPIYPILRQAQQVGITMSPQGVAAAQPERLWQFSDKAAEWTVSLTDGFVTLATTAYGARSDFCQRFGVILEALVKTVDPVIYDRVGLRYVNRVPTTEANNLERLVRPEVLGAKAIPVAKGAMLLHSITDAQFATSGRRVQTRWGILPANVSHDPTMEPTDQPCWFLDVDVFTEDRGDFVAGDIVEQLTEFADQAYRMFRWAITEQGLQEFGGQL